MTGAQSPSTSTSTAATLTARDYRPGEVHHIVLFRFADGVAADQRREVEDRFRALAHTPHPDGTGPYIRSIAAGAQSSQENAGHGFELAFVVRFASEGDRNFYVGTPLVSDPAHFDRQHADFKDFVGPLLADGDAGVLVFDFSDAEHPALPWGGDMIADRTTGMGPQ